MSTICAGIWPLQKAPETLKNRSSFLAARRGCKLRRAGFSLLARGDNGMPYSRVGYTVSRKCGNAVMRNRIKRRLRAAMRLAVRNCRTGHDYVIIATGAARQRNFEHLLNDLSDGIGTINRMVAQRHPVPAISNAQSPVMKAPRRSPERRGPNLSPTPVSAALHE